MLARETAAASGLPIKVGPCMSVPGAAWLTPLATSGAAECCCHGRVAAGERLAQAEDVGVVTSCSLQPMPKQLHRATRAWARRLRS